MPSSKKKILIEARVSVSADVGKQPSFDVVAYTGGKMRPMFWDDVVIDLAGLTAPDQEIPVLLDHDETEIVGQTTAVVIGQDVRVSGVVTGDLSSPGAAAKVVAHARGGFKWKASVGVIPEVIEDVLAGAKANVNGSEFTGPFSLVRKGTLREVSIVSIAADGKTRVKVAAKAGKGETMDFNEWLRAKGFDPAGLTDEQRDTLLKTHQAELAASASPPAAGAAPPSEVDAALAPLRARAARADGRGRVIASWGDRAAKNGNTAAIATIEATARLAQAEDWTPERLELRLWQDTQLPPAVNTPTASSQDLDQDVIECAFARASGLQNIEKHYSSRVLEASERRYRGGLGLGRLLLMAARINANEADITLQQTEDLLRASGLASGRRREPVRASGGPSTLDIADVLSNVANKFLVQYFNAVESVWRAIAAIASVADFKQISFYSLTGDLQYVQVPPGGEITHGTLGNQKYTNQADTYGKMLSIDRRDIINDDVGALDRITQRLGRGAALKLNDVFWSVFLNNSSFFTSGNGNYSSGAATALDFDSLVDAEVLFLSQTDYDGKPLGAPPANLLVPTPLKEKALQLMRSTEIRRLPDTTSTGAATRVDAITNTMANRFNPLSSMYLDKSGYTGYSAKAWYLLADPVDLPVIQVVFLNGQQMPVVESAQADFDRLGIRFRGYHDFGVSLHEKKGGVKMKGEA